MAGDKPFDAVRLMRELRDRMSREFGRMTFEEQKRRMDEVLGKDNPPAEGGSGYERAPYESSSRNDRIA